MSTSVVIAAVASVATGLVVTWIVSRAAPPVGLIDTPNPRSSHSRATPRSGGIGVIAGAAVGVAVLSISGVTVGNRLSWLLAGTLAIAVVGVIDDLRPTPALARLLAQVVVATTISAALGGLPSLPLPSPLDVPTGPLAIPLSALWMVGVTNFYNFMDGIDGLAAGQAIASCIGVAIAGWSTDSRAFAIVFAAAALGFLVLNRPPAKIFLGDVGSTSIGFTLAGLALVAGPVHRSSAVLAVAVGLSLFLLDPVETLVRLARQGHTIWSPHRLHSYQILTRTYNSHATVAIALLTAGLALSVAGAISYRVPALGWPVLAIAAAVYWAERYVAGKRSAG